MIYIDKSSFLRLLFLETFAVEIETQLSGEEGIVISELTLLEIEVQLRALRYSGAIGHSKSEKLAEQVTGMLESGSFLLMKVSAAIFGKGVRQHRVGTVHCRSLDRLHLAAMEDLGLRRLMTHDFRQAEAARELGIEVVMPGM